MKPPALPLEFSTHACLGAQLAKAVVATATALVFFPGPQSFGAAWTMEEVALPALRIEAQRATAHTQGLEVVGDTYYVTARREDVNPRRALLLRANPSRTHWAVWDITPTAPSGAPTALDHPGGMQSDGERLWIPVAESKRNGRALIRAYLLADMQEGHPLEPDSEFAVSDHIGAIAVASDRTWLLGAHWDTAGVQAWELNGRPLWTLAGDALNQRGLGIEAGGLAVQDWKMIGGQLFASGLYRRPAGRAGRLIVFDRFQQEGSSWSFINLPAHRGIELAREGMAIAGGYVHFLPEDLGATNRLFRIRLPELLKRRQGEHAAQPLRQE